MNMSDWKSVKNQVETSKKDEEMSIVGLVEKPEEDPNFLQSFKSSKQSIDNYEHIALTGKSFSGKTRLALSFARVVDDLITKDLPPAEATQLIELIKSKKIPSIQPVYVIGTEESVGDELNSVSNLDYYSNVDIKYLEISEYNGGTYDYVGTYNKFLKCIGSFKNMEGGTLIIDSSSPIIQAMHYIMRTKIMKIDPMSKEQGVPMRYWFWRNQQAEQMMLVLKNIRMHKVQTWKIVPGFNKEKGDDDDAEPKVRWHEETCYHLSKTRVDQDLKINKKSKEFVSTINKCRNKPSLFGKQFKNLNASKLLLEIYKKGD